MKRYGYIVVMLLFAACTGNKQTGDSAKKRGLQELKWMLGSWQNVMQDGILSEQWKVTSDTLWTGEGNMVDTAGNIIFSEQLQLVLKADTVWYIPTVGNQNGGLPVRFMQTAISDTSVVFENIQHDFPQRIVYHKTSDSTLYVYIEGLQDGKNRKEEFNYKKR